MSGPIKPEDVTPELAKSLLGWTSIVPWQARAKVAEMANAMIEAGLVSPPVYTVRDDKGNLLDDAVYGLWATKDAALLQHEGDHQAEHWRGQKE